MWCSSASRALERVVALGHRREDRLLVRERGVGVVGALDVGAEEAGEVDDASARLEDGLDRAVLVADLEDHPAALGVLHLAREGAHPDAS